MDRDTGCHRALHDSCAGRPPTDRPDQVQRHRHRRVAQRERRADAGPDWTLTHNELIRDGFAWVGVRPSRRVERGQGQDAHAGDAVIRLATPRLSHPGDSFSYDIFSQAGQAIRDNSALMLGGLTPNKLIAAGESQSAGRMVTYIDAVQPLVHVYDGFLVHSRFAAGAASRKHRRSTSHPPATAKIRDDLDVPVFVFETETDVLGSNLADRQPDTAKFRALGGRGHLALRLLRPRYRPRPTPGDGRGVAAHLASMQNPTNQSPDAPVHLRPADQHRAGALGARRRLLLAQPVGGEGHCASARSAPEGEPRIAGRVRARRVTATSAAVFGRRKWTRRSPRSAAWGTAGPVRSVSSADSSGPRCRSQPGQLTLYPNHARSSKCWTTRRNTALRAASFGRWTRSSSRTRRPARRSRRNDTHPSATLPARVHPPGKHAQRGGRVTESLTSRLRTQRSEMMVSELEAIALRLFEPRGFDQVTVDDITRKPTSPSGPSTGTSRARRRLPTADHPPQRRPRRPGRDPAARRPPMHSLGLGALCGTDRNGGPRLVRRWISYRGHAERRERSARRHPAEDPAGHRRVPRCAGCESADPLAPTMLAPPRKA